MGSDRRGHGGLGGREQRGGGQGSGCGPRKCTYCHGENHIVDFCWDLMVNL